MLRKVSLFFLVLALIFSGITAYAVWKDALPLVSPIALVEVIIGNSAASKSPKVIYGFFPYWNSKYADELNINLLTHFAYFAVDLNPDGSINKANSKREQEPGWNKLNSKTVGKLLYQSKLLDQKTVLTITAMDTDLIDSILSNPQNFDNAIKSIIDVYHQYDFDDINIDFEYIGEPNEKIRGGFVAFIQSLKNACLGINKYCQIDIDVFGDAATKYRLWDLNSLNQTVDHVIVMAYDYYRKSSSQAGPVAPLTGKCQTKNNNLCLEQDIMFHISEMTKIVSPEKIILGIPFYGYEWQTAGKDFLANTYPGTGSMASYSRIQTIFSDPDVSSLSAKWSESTLSPYLVFEIDKEIHQIHFENPESIKQKIKLIKSAGLGGIAIWALGYETPFPDLWNPIKSLTTL